MEIRFKVDDRDTLELLKNLRSEDRVTAWSEAILELAIRSARERIGGKFGEQQIAAHIELDNRGDSAEIRMDRTNAYIGEHVHFGGPIRSRNGKMLAIPLPNESTAKYNPHRRFASAQTVELFKLRSKKGNELLFVRPEKGKPLEKPLFVLKRETAPQAARPWWPTQAEAEAETVRYFKENF